jgi:hypothetical protein
MLAALQRLQRGSIAPARRVLVSRSARVVVPCKMTSMMLELNFNSLAKSVGSIAVSYRIIAERNTPLGLDAQI